MVLRAVFSEIEASPIVLALVPEQFRNIAQGAIGLPFIDAVLTRPRSHRSAHCRTDDSGGNVRYGSNVHFAFFNRAVISFTSRFIFSQTLKTPL